MRRTASVPWLIAAAGVVVTTILVVRCAWLCDDAYITLRAIDNFVNGFGPRWNVAERVQAFTHPLWFLLIAPFYAVTREAYYTVIGLQLGLAMVTVGLMCRVVARSATEALVCVAALVASKAFIDYSTSGLENPLSHLLIVMFLMVWWRDLERKGSLLGLGVVTSLMLTCRLDLGVLILPLLLVTLWRTSVARFTTFATGLVPLVAWEFFSLVYYGSLVPNTALAKLPAGGGPLALAPQGVRYLMATFHFDAVTPLFIAGAMAGLLWRGSRDGRAIAAGMALHVVYVVSVGGDFMSGRFLTASFVLGACGVARSLVWPRPRWFPPTLAAALVACSLLDPTPPLTAGRNFGTGGQATDQRPRAGVTDERAFYYEELGLLRVIRGEGAPARHPGAVFGRTVRAGGKPSTVVIASSIGLFGYYAGPGVYIIDRNALADPFLARLPPLPGWRPGHLERAIPAGYFESRRDGTNRIEDPALRRAYDVVVRITCGPVWSGDRLLLILRVLFRGIAG